MFCVAKARIGVAELLIKNGANINAKDEDGFNSLHSATAWGLEFILFLFLSLLTVFYHLYSGNKRMVECFLKHKCNIDDGIDGNEYTALHLAAKFGLDLFEQIVVIVQTHDKPMNLSRVCTSA